MVTLKKEEKFKGNSAAASEAQLAAGAWLDARGKIMAGTPESAAAASLLVIQHGEGGHASRKHIQSSLKQLLVGQPELLNSQLRH